MALCAKPFMPPRAAAGQVEARGADPSPEQIARWVEQLGDNDFATREKATELLWKAGSAAESALQQALKSTDLEVVRRARELLDRFKFGIYPDTPAEVVRLIERYRTEWGGDVRRVFEACAY